MLYNKKFLQKNRIVQPPPPNPTPNPTPTPNVFVKIVFLQPISEKLLESPYTFLLFCF